MSPSYTLAPQAYALPLLHAAAHPSSTVHGVLLASSSSSSSSGTSTLITHAIPLVHAHATASPITEAALEHVRVYASDKGLRVVGVYEAAEGTEGGGLSRAGRGLGKGVMEMAGGAGEAVLVLSVDNARLAKGENAYTVYTSTDYSKPAPPSTLALENASAPSKTLALIRNDAERRSERVRVRDFDDHIEDASADWLSNSSACDAIKKHVG